MNALEGFLAARRGELAEGERLSRRAVEVAATIDMYEHKARAYEWHARTLAIVGKPAEAREAAEVALAIYEAKGDLPGHRLGAGVARLASGRLIARPVIDFIRSTKFDPCRWRQAPRHCNGSPTDPTPRGADDPAGGRP